MIIGLGSDLIDIRRIEASLAKHGDRFTHRIFTEIERKKSDARRNRAASYAKRFAAKEAMVKALGTGIAQGIFWRDIGVVNLAGGKPTIALTGAASAKLLSLMPPHHTPHIHVTITDDYPLAQAFVIIEGIYNAPPPEPNY